MKGPCKGSAPAANRYTPCAKLTRSSDPDHALAADADMIGPLARAMPPMHRDKGRLHMAGEKPGVEQRHARCPLPGVKQTSANKSGMSALTHLRHWPSSLL